MHRKVLLVDGEEVWLGSANMTRDSLRMHGNLMVGIKDPAVGNSWKKISSVLQELLPSNSLM